MRKPKKKTVKARFPTCKGGYKFKSKKVEEKRRPSNRGNKYKKNSNHNEEND